MFKNIQEKYELSAYPVLVLLYPDLSTKPAFRIMRLRTRRLSIPPVLDLLET